MALLGLSLLASAGAKPVLGGYDMVAYYHDGDATLGVTKFNATLRTQDCAFDASGACRDRFAYTFYFKDAANRDAFSADPWSFAPKYGGF